MNINTINQSTKANVTIAKDFTPVIYNPHGSNLRGVAGLSQAQIASLQVKFQVDPMPNPSTRQAIAKELGMSPRAVNIWFKTRRNDAKSNGETLPHRIFQWKQADRKIKTVNSKPFEQKQKNVVEEPVRVPEVSPVSSTLPSPSFVGTLPVFSDSSCPSDFPPATPSFAPSYSELPVPEFDLASLFSQVPSPVFPMDSSSQTASPQFPTYTAGNPMLQPSLFSFNYGGIGGGEFSVPMSGTPMNTTSSVCCSCKGGLKQQPTAPLAQTPINPPSDILKQHTWSDAQTQYVWPSQLDTAMYSLYESSYHHQHLDDSLLHLELPLSLDSLAMHDTFNMSMNTLDHWSHTHTPPDG
jgi:hypothetical protein